MKRIGITQRVDFIESYSETRDCLDQRWNLFMQEMGFLLIPLNNVNIYNTSVLIEKLSIEAIILSGGNSIYKIDPHEANASEKRDKFEESIFVESQKKNIKIFGICRGMQMINLLMGGNVSKVKNHVCVKHKIKSIHKEYSFSSKVNSFHNWGIKKTDLSKQLIPIAMDENENVEAFTNKENNIFGVMWHPEREFPFNENDIKLFKNFFL